MEGKIEKMININVEMQENNTNANNMRFKWENEKITSINVEM